MSLKLEDVSFVYGAGTSSETKALNNVNLEKALFGNLLP